MTEQRIFRGRHTSRFTSLPNKMFEDDALSVEAKGVLGYLISRPPNWHVRPRHLCDKLKIGKDRLQRIFRELIAAGYVERKPARKKNGKFHSGGYLVHDEPSVASLPQPEKPQPARPEPVKPQPVNQVAYKKRIPTNTESINNHINKPLPQTPSPIAPAAPAVAKRLGDERVRRPEHQSVVQARLAERLGAGNTEAGWLILGALTDSERESLTTQERAGRLAADTIADIALRLRARLSKSKNAA